MQESQIAARLNFSEEPLFVVSFSLHLRLFKEELPHVIHGSRPAYPGRSNSG
jgi:hypothetical protein